MVEESEGERDELTSTLVRYPRHNFATMSKYLSLPNNIIRREIFVVENIRGCTIAM